MRWYLTVILVCISLIISNVEQLFMCLFAVCISSLEKCLFRSSANFSVGLFDFSVVELSCLYILETRPCPWHHFKSFLPFYSLKHDTLLIYYIVFSNLNNQQKNKPGPNFVLFAIFHAIWLISSYQ